MCLEGDIAEQTEDVVAMCRSCLQAHCVQHALATGRWWREVPLVLSRAANPEDADRGPLAIGRVDMVYQDGGELIVIDYKTDRDVTRESAEQHALAKRSGQAEIYAQALAATTGLPVREVVFVYCKPAVEVRLGKRLGLAQGGCFLETETTLLLKKDEKPLLDAPVDLLKEVVDREFRAGSQGVSIPLGGGVRYRVGATRGHIVTIGTHWATADSGRLTVTDQRIVYHGARKTLEFPFAKLATLNVYSDAIDLGVTSRQSTSSFRTADPELVAGIIHAAVNHRDEDVTIVRLRTGPSAS